MTVYADRWHRSPDGLRLYARDYAGAAGEARLPVIAIHGLTRNSADFDAIAPLIAQSGRRVLAVDIRGRGRSDRAPDPMTYQPAVYARDVLALMRQCGIERAVFLGTSMGGLITMALAAVRSKAIDAAIINDVGPEVAKEGLARIAAYTRRATPRPGPTPPPTPAAPTRSPSPTTPTPTGPPSPGGCSPRGPRAPRS